MSDRYCINEYYYEDYEYLLNNEISGIIKTWVFYYSDDTTETLTMLEKINP